MPNVVVYVPAAAWRGLEEAGREPKLVVRKLVAEHLFDPELMKSSAGEVVKAERFPEAAAPGQDVEGGRKRSRFTAASTGSAAPGRPRLRPRQLPLARSLALALLRGASSDAVTTPSQGVLHLLTAHTSNGETAIVSLCVPSSFHNVERNRAATPPEPQAGDEGSV